MGILLEQPLQGSDAGAQQNSSQVRDLKHTLLGPHFQREAVSTLKDFKKTHNSAKHLTYI